MTLRTLLQMLSLLLILTVTAACPTRGGRGGGGGDDDDATGDDDDATGDDDDATGDDDDATGDDDDATGDDDDATAPPPGDCPGGYTVFTESEPNDASPYDDIGSQSGPFCIEGSVLCGDASGYDDVDIFVVNLTAGVWDFSLQWSGSADFDSYLWIEEPTPDAEALFAFQESLSSPENDSAEVSAGQYWIQVACWEGTSGGYILTADPAE